MKKIKVWLTILCTFLVLTSVFALKHTEHYYREDIRYIGDTGACSWYYLHLNITNNISVYCLLGWCGIDCHWEINKQINIMEVDVNGTI